MNHDIPPFNNPAQEREWQAQERALHAERLGLDPSNGDERVRRYRMLARALREPVPSALPDDFARQMAARVAAAPARGGADDSRIEFVLMGALVAALAVAAGVVVADYGSAWLPAFRQLLPASGAPATSWILALGSCLGVSWLLGLWQKPRHAATG
ncbi:hypothetical protein [Rhodanobacter sp. DHB23]|uniref:hypothetical protein n=1 Tax=Rhodanobacter sp. DHB23 TaxID=2775923 RepID=UPI0017826D7D|nr:hypothetical protein [Rhodanobacter sp. DHB23]MBD8874163.1 hypothetical protein [Rhodanobacter sp. DHB23]